MSLKQVARLFTGVGVTGEFPPGSWWEGVDLVWPAPTAGHAGRHLGEVFDRVVAEMCGDAEVVGVNFSGGLDSLAVLAAVCRLVPARRVVAFTVDLAADDGASTAAAAGALVAGFGLPVDLVVVEPDGAGPVPPWSPLGPRFDALPHVNARVNAAAVEAGCGVLLSGNGADELLAAGSFAAAEVAARWGARGARRYLADLADTAAGWPGEVAAVAARMLPAGWSARAYWAANWPGLCRPTVSPVLASRHVEAALGWAAGWVRGQVADHARARRSWAQADRIDTFWPRGFCPAAGGVPEGSPFLHPDLVAAGLAVPVALRYDPRPAHAYHRIKPLVVGLFPGGLKDRLPVRKRYYATALSSAVAGPLAAPVCVEAGLLDAAAVASCDQADGGGGGVLARRGGGSRAPALALFSVRKLRASLLSG
ncbi:asparagine synthase-related protein [Micromonospora inyonensis]|uniref:asparagine synthase-related protein n=1 Tax=Micromonospora inyonensis TaxID=47866 RepID=UPI000B887E0A|nr:asparagine synthase-related protein [Micromonospora inyonensis]